MFILDDLRMALFASPIAIPLKVWGGWQEEQ